MSSERNNEKGLGGLTESDLKTLTDVLEQQPFVELALLFGSRAKGTYKNGSDVDIALKGKQLDFETTSHISYILNEETQLPYRIDILNYYALNNKALVDHIDRIGVVFYKQ